VRAPFDVKKWTEKLEEAVATVKNGRKRHFVSEPVPVPIEGSLIKKVVGSTYETFVMDPNHDVLMMYVAKDSKPCKEFKGAFIAFVKEYFATGNRSIKFGWIDIQRNSSPMDFPTIHILPHFELWPMKNKSDHDQLRGPKSRDNLVRFLQSRTTEPFPLSAPPPDKFQTAITLLNMLMNGGDRVALQEVDKFVNYLFETADSIGVDLSTAPGFEDFANQLPSGRAKEIARARATEDAMQAAKEAELIMKKLHESPDL
jgi:hypothetical protein